LTGLNKNREEYLGV
jgi:hypothetical protein